MNKLIAEGFGTALLVLFGCGSVVLAGFPGTPAGLLQISVAFGFVLMMSAYMIGNISGCHINPAVTAAFAISGRMTWGEAVQYMIAQVAGAIIGAGLLYMMAQGKLGGFDFAKSGLGQNGWGKGYLGEFNTLTAAIAEFIGTFVFIGVILVTTGKKGVGNLAGLIIGLTLLLIHLIFIPITGVSVNPARSIGPALYVGGNALSQLWLFILVPLAAGLLAGKVFCKQCTED